MLADLRESGSHRAGRRRGAVHLPRRVYNPEVAETRATREVIVAKHRNGPTGQGQPVVLEAVRALREPPGRVAGAGPRPTPMSPHEILAGGTWGFVRDGERATTSRGPCRVVADTQDAATHGRRPVHQAGVHRRKASVPTTPAGAAAAGVAATGVAAVRSGAGPARRLPAPRHRRTPGGAGGRHRVRPPRIGCPPLLDHRHRGDGSAVRPSRLGAPRRAGRRHHLRGRERGEGGRGGDLERHGGRRCGGRRRGRRRRALGIGSPRRAGRLTPPWPRSCSSCWVTSRGWCSGTPRW